MWVNLLIDEPEEEKCSYDEKYDHCLACAEVHSLPQLVGVFDRLDGWL